MQEARFKNEWKKTSFDERLRLSKNSSNMTLITIGQLKHTMLAINKFMDGIRNTSKVVITQNHYVIAEVKLNLRKNGQKLIALRQKTVYWKPKLQNQEMEIAFAKKLVEIRNREVDKGTNSGQLKS